MDINIRLFLDRLRRLLAGEEGTLPDDAAKQVIQNFQAEIEIFTSLLSEYKFELVWLVMQQIGSEENQIDYPDLLAIMEEIHSLVYVSEMVIDTFVMGIMQQESESGSKDICEDHLPGLQSKIIDIKQRLQQVQHFHPDIVSELIHEYENISNDQASSWYKNKDIVGLDERMEELLDLLIEGPPQLSLVALLDSAEVDKTAFAAEAYNSNYVKHYFDCLAWVPASVFYDSNKILDDIIKCVVPLFKLGEVMDKNYEMRKKYLRDYLMSKRYLIVVDDVWGEKEFDDIRDVLPDNQNGSRVVTTISETNILTSFQLENGENIPLDLVPPGRPLRVTHNGWPILILYHGSISFEENIGETAETPLGFKTIQYSLLPFHLKICLLYLFVFPVHFEISTRQLYQLWIAEGFIPDNNEATAEGYLQHLINLGLVEAKKRRVGGTIKTCFVPGRWWLAVMLLAYVSGFIYARVWDRGDLAGKSQENVKRLTAQIDVFEFDDLHGFNWWCLHSLLYLSSKIRHLDPMKSEEICKRFKFLRVLDLGYLVLNQYPSGIENLFLLIYLKLNIPSLKSLPSSICNLLNLYTLDLPSSYIDYIADDIWKLSKLRHLNFGLVTLPAHLGKHCISLENLNFISALHPSCCTPDILGRLPNLQNLRIYGDLSYYQSFLSKSLCRLSCLEYLKLVNASKVPWLSKIAIVEYQFPPSLTHLSLSNTELMDDPMPTLENLPHLQVLKLKQNSYLGRKLACGSNGFPKLKVLQLKSMLWLEEWTMEIGAMPKLEFLMINPCAYLKRIPEQLWCRKSLNKLELWWPQPELRQKVRDFEDKQQYDIQIYPLGM